MRQGPRPVAERVFHERAEFAECEVVLGDQKERIVAESACTLEVRRDDAMTSAFGQPLDFALRIGYGGNADIVGRAAIFRQRSQFGQQACIVCSVITLLTGVSRRMHPRPSIEPRNYKPAVFR